VRTSTSSTRPTNGGSINSTQPKNHPIAILGSKTHPRATPKIEQIYLMIGIYIVFLVSI
jgi:hypothetical protein